MKTLLLSTLLFISVLQSRAQQSSIGTVNEFSNLREGPGLEFESDLVVNPGATLFIFPIDSTKEFYNVVHIKSGKEGWIKKSLVKITNEIEKSKGHFMASKNKIVSEQSEAHIFNNTDESLKIKLGSVTYTLAPHQKRNIQIAAGKAEYFAYVAGVTPTTGDHIFEPATRYEWQFYMGTEGGKSKGWVPPKRTANARKRTV